MGEAAHKHASLPLSVQPSMRANAYGGSSYIIVTCTESPLETTSPSSTTATGNITRFATPTKLSASMDRPLPVTEASRALMPPPTVQRRPRSPIPSPTLELRDFRWDSKQGPRPLLPWDEDEEENEAVHENKPRADGGSTSTINTWMPATAQLNARAILQRKMSTASAIGHRLRLTTKRRRTAAPNIGSSAMQPTLPKILMGSLERATTLPTSPKYMHTNSRALTRNSTVGRATFTRSTLGSQSVTSLAQPPTYSIYKSRNSRQCSSTADLPQGLAPVAMRYRQPNYLRALTKIHIC